jgi:hypothetical protein
VGHDDVQPFPAGPAMPNIINVNIQSEEIVVLRIEGVNELDAEALRGEIINIIKIETKWNT